MRLSAITVLAEPDGVCRRCGAPAVRRTKLWRYCSRHAPAGVCGLCLAKVFTHRVRICPGCQERTGLCRYCEKAPRVPATAGCRKCLDARNAITERWKGVHRPRSRRCGRRSCRKRSVRRIGHRSYCGEHGPAGTCAVCLAGGLGPMTHLCPPCSEQTGLCPFCGLRPVREPGRSNCFKCWKRVTIGWVKGNERMMKAKSCSIINERVVEVERCNDTESLFRTKKDVERFVGLSCSVEPMLEGPFDPEKSRALVFGRCPTCGTAFAVDGRHWRGGRYCPKCTRPGEGHQKAY